MILQYKRGTNASAMLAVLKLTYYEYVNRKIFFASIIFYTLTILVLILGFGKKTNYLVHPYFLSFLFYLSQISLLLSGFDIIPKMIREGSVELILSKPMTRTRLLVYQYISTVFIIPISSFFFFLIVSILYFVKSGVFDFAYLRLFVFTLITFAIYGASFLPVSLLLYRSSVNLLICLIFITANVIPNLMYWLTLGKVELASNYIVGFLYTVSPRLVQLCDLAVQSNIDGVTVFTHSVLFITVCLFLSYVVMKRKDF